MPKYKVTAILERGYEAYIEAKDDDDAFKKAQDMELEEFEENDQLVCPEVWKCFSPKLNLKNKYRKNKIGPT